jgi:hypothetical protein
MQTVLQQQKKTYFNIKSIPEQKLKIYQLANEKCFMAKIEEKYTSRANVLRM